MNNSSSLVVFLGFLLFGIFFLGLLTYSLTRSWNRSVMVALNSIGGKLRQLQSQVNEFRSGLQSFSPGDPEPFGPLVEAALDHLVGVEVILRGLFEQYSAQHEDITKLRKIVGWKLIRLPLLWYKKRFELINLASDMVKYESGLNELFQYQERLNQLNADVAKSCQKILQTSNQASSIFEKLHQSGIEGQPLERAREEIRNWQTTILNQVPVLFFSTDAEIIRSQTDKETTARVHRLNQTAGEQISRLLGEAETWNQNLHDYSDHRDKLIEGLPKIKQIISDMSLAPYFPIGWDQTKKRFETLSGSADDLEHLASSHKVDDLSHLASEAGRCFEEMILLSEKLVDIRSNHLELCSLTLSEDMVNGPETLKSAYTLAKKISEYDVNNFQRSDGAETLASDLRGIASQQGHFQRYSPTSEVNEAVLSKILEIARNLTLQYRSLSPRLQSLQKRLNEIQEIEQQALSKLDDLRQFVSESESMIDASPQFKKIMGAENQKIKNQILLLSEELSRRGKDPVDKKAEHCHALYLRAIKDVEKWSEVLSSEVDKSRGELSTQAGVLRDIVWIDDPVMVDVENLLSSASSVSFLQKEILDKPDRLLNKYDQLMKVNEILQSYQSTLQRINQVTGSILINYKQVERLHDAVDEIMRKLNETLPKNEEAWPPTTIRIESERTRFEQLNKEWKSIRKNRMRVSELSAKLSGMIIEYKTLETDLNESLSNIKQEQGRFTDYERRLENSRRMWNKIAAAHVENIFVRDGTAQLIKGIDQDLQRLQMRYKNGELNFSLALQGMKQICRKLDEGVVDFDPNHIIDINGEVQRRL